MRYKRKVDYVDAVRWTGENKEEVEKLRGYDIDSFDIINGKYYCPGCHPEYPYKQYRREDNAVIYKSFDDILKAYGGTIKDYVRVCE